jgi:P27 family predicted phage terminase small subunit
MRKLRNDIIKHLKAKGQYDPDVDDYMIDMLIENIEFMVIAKKDILENGLIQRVTGRNNAMYTKTNPSLNCYQMSMRNIHQCSAKLGINRKDRLMLKLVQEKEQDELDKLLNEK